MGAYLFFNFQSLLKIINFESKLITHDSGD